MSFHKTTSQIIDILENGKYWFEKFEHEPVKTSEEASKIRLGYTLNQGAKSMIVRIKKTETDKQFVMLVLPGDLKFDSAKVKKFFNIKDLRFASEEEIAQITDGIQIGGVPPFGNLFGLQVIADPKIFENEKMIFNAGDRCVSVAMLSKDYRVIVKPLVDDITM